MVKAAETSIYRTYLEIFPDNKGWRETPRTARKEQWGLPSDSCSRAGGTSHWSQIWDETLKLDQLANNSVPCWVIAKRERHTKEKKIVIHHSIPIIWRYPWVIRKKSHWKTYNIAHVNSYLLKKKKKKKKTVVIRLLLKVYANADMFWEWKDCFCLN